LFDFFVLRQGERFLIDIATSVAQAFAQRLTMYRLRAAVDIEMSDVIVTPRPIDAPLDGTFDDPRHPELGTRHYGTAQETNASEELDSVYVKNGIPRTGIELISNDSYILEAGFERINGVDFKKGCYVGQEVTARMKHKTELRKGLAVVQVEGAAEVGTPITRDGKAVGTLYSQANGQGIAYLRFDRAGEDMNAGVAKVSFKR
jgi:folate-binding protein YgfZ